MTRRTLLSRLALVLAAAVAVAVAVLFARAAPTAAHPILLNTTPQAGYSIAAAPDVITLVFDEPVTAASQGVRLTDGDQHPMRTSEVVREQGGRHSVSSSAR